MMRERLLAGVNDGLASGGKPSLGAQLGPLVDVLSRLIGFMKKRLGKYRIEDSSYVFDLDADADGFNALRDELEREKVRLKALSETKLQSVRRSSERFGEWAQDPFNRPRPPRGDGAGSPP